MWKKLVQNHSFDSGTHQAMNCVCLACGHVGCGEISTSASAHWIEDSAKQNSNGPEKHEEGFPKGHSGKHALLAKHPMALQCGEKLVCWCFICNVVVDYASPLAASSEAPCEAEDRQLEGLPSSGSAPLRQAAKLVGEKLAKERAISTNQGRFDHIDQPVTSLTDETTNPSSTECANLTPFLNGHCSFSRRKRLLKGLMNLGNTCFFNSVMQNLLALDMLRDYFSQDSKVVEGPLTSSLRLLYLETNPEMPAYGHTDVLGFESGLKRGGKGRMVWESTGGAYNPRSLFGAICAKAPRFRGYQQQDSHELLRCLLEGLNSEERSTGITEGESSITLMNSNRVSDIESREETEAADAERPIANTQIPNFVEFFFGGQLSSTVRCCECGHTSVVYEPVLDLSLQMQVSKKGQARANQGSSEKGPSHRVVKSTKAVQSPDWPDTPHPCSLVVSENNEVSAKIIPSASSMQNHSLAAENANTSSKEDASLDDCGWLDFVGGGIQSADGSLQGSIDSISSAQNSEDILNVDTEGSVHENILMEVLQPFSSDKCGSSDSTNHFESVGTDGIDESVATSCVVPAANNKHCPVKPLVDSSVMDAHRSVVMAPPILDEDVENKLLVAQTEEEEGPLPLASGVLLLPYEQLQAPSITEGLESIQADTFNLDESSCSLEGEDKSTQLNLVLEDNGDFDGFSELFEEDETFTVKGKSIGVTRNFQVTEESYLHGSWDANTGPVVGGESGLRTGEPQKVFDHQDSILPMSLEGCLADFTKAELLSGENAWECESCAKCVKENASPLASNKDCNKPICNEEVIPKTVGDNSGNQVYHFLHRYDLNSVGKDVGGTSFNSNGNTSHMDYVGCSMTSCTTIGSNAPPMTVVDGLCSEILLACRSQASCNGTIEFSASTPKAGELVGGKVEANGRIGNGSARLNELDSGQLCGSGSPLRQRHNAESEPGNCSESLGEIPPTRLVSAEQVETGVAERWQTINQDGDGDDGDQSVHAGRPSAQSSERKHVQVDCISLGDVPPGTSSSTSEEKLPGPYRILGKPLKSQKYKKKKPQVENVKVVKRDATKRLLISKAPPILTIHLKRFAQDIRGRLNKLSGHVTFPLLLDLRPFLDSKCLDLDKCVYRLVGIVEHGGTMRGGHYVAYVRGPPSDEPDQESDLMEYERKSSWYYISDSSVHKSTQQAVLNSEAYLLFYEKYEVI